MLPEGTIIDNRYEIVCALGEGAFGAVYKANHKQLDRQVALKMLNTAILLEADGLARFEREALALSALKHKNIVGFYGYGAWQNAPYMVMELLEGQSLETKLAREPKLNPKYAAHTIRDVFEGLSSAHAAGIVHRDLKPSNIMLVAGPDSREQVKLIDFGLVKLMPHYGVPGQKLTETGYALGTCYFMAPEQALGRPVDHRADIYSAGCILYRMLSGRYPFDGDDNVAVMMMHLNELAQPLAPMLGTHPMGEAMATIVQNCIEKDPDDRYQTCGEVLADLDALLRGSTHKVKPLVVHSPMSNSPWKANKSAVVLALAVVAAGLMVPGALSLWVNHSANKPRWTSAELYDQVVLVGGNPAGVAATTIEYRELGQQYDAKGMELVERALTQHDQDQLLRPSQQTALARRAAYMLLSRLRNLEEQPSTPDIIREIATTKVRANAYLNRILVARKREPLLQSSFEDRYLMALLLAFGRLSQAAAIGDNALTRVGPDIVDMGESKYIRDIRHHLMHIRTAQGRLDAAEALAKQTLVMERDNDHRYTSYCVLGDAACARDDYEDAAQCYREAIALPEKSPRDKQVQDHDKARANWGLARCNLARKKYADALKYANTASEIYRTRYKRQYYQLELIRLASIAALQGASTAANSNTASLLMREKKLAQYEVPQLAKSDVILATQTLRVNKCDDLAAKLSL